MIMKNKSMLLTAVLFILLIGATFLGSLWMVLQSPYTVEVEMHLSGKNQFRIRKDAQQLTKIGSRP